MRLDELTQLGWGNLADSSMREMWSTKWPNWMFGQLWIPKWIQLQTHDHWQHLESVELLIARSLDMLKYRYIGEHIYIVFGVCLVYLVHMHAHSAGISSWVWNDQHLRQIVHHTAEAICQGDIPYIQHFPVLPHSVDQENKYTKKQTNCYSHSSLLQTLHCK